MHEHGGMAVARSDALGTGESARSGVYTRSRIDVELLPMCGRYVRRSDKQRIAEHFRVNPGTFPDLDLSYSVAPQTFQPIVRLNRETGEREIVLMRWGLIPF
jgi:hypothetical protein